MIITKRATVSQAMSVMWRWLISYDFFSQQITPLRGPREGGTLVTIRGENLGLDFREIQGNVKVAEVDCTPIREGYIPAEQ